MFSEDPKSKKKTAIFYLSCLLVIFLDQLSKYFIRYTFQLGDGVCIVKNIFSICYIKNQGIAFGLLANFKEIFIYVNIVLVIIFIFIYQKIKRQMNQIIISLIFGLIIGGAISNIMDRILFNGVVDFLDIGWKKIRWPAFNLADMSICTGMVLLCFFILREDKEKKIS
ncbi:MAG: signal peptidase II [bacterium]|nr:signal peptidase II [bacterium]